MKKISTLLALLCITLISAQNDFSDRWEDFFSYNNVKDFVINNDQVFALTDNAIFSYNITTEELRKVSSVNGLSGEQTSTIHYNETFDRIVIGYETGLVEVISDDGSVTVSPDIVNFNQSGLKRVNDIFEHDGKLFISTSFAIVVYDIERLEFGDTYFIGPASSSVNVNETTVLNNEIYAATDIGVFVADVNNPNLIDAANWTRRFTGSFQKIISYEGNVYAVSNRELIRLNGTTQQTVLSFPENIVDVNVSNQNLVIALSRSANVYNASLALQGTNTTSTAFDFTLNTATVNGSTILLGTSEFGLLSAAVASPTYTEIHPEGPLSNEVFSIDVFNNNLWVVYGGYDVTFTPTQTRQGFSRFDGENWVNTPFDPANPFGDLVSITIDKNSDNRVFISSFGDTRSINTRLTGGLYEIVDDNVVNFYNNTNSPLEDILPADPTRVTVRISGSAFDREGNLWVTNILGNSRLKKLSPNGNWTNYDINELYVQNRPGMGEITIDNTNTVWMTTRSNGLFAYNENGDRKRALTTEPTRGNLPNRRTTAVAVDRNNRLWIGTLTGLVVYNNPASIFDATVFDAEPIIILDDGIPKRLLGDQTVNSIKVDGANNKWFGTENGGALYTNPNGQNTLANFNKENSPLPSNKILKIAVDEFTGKVFFATDRGIVAYNSNVDPFGDTLGEVYAYPNPVLKNNDTVTIDGRNGTNLPRGTNVKILDVSGNLVYETNVVEGQEVQGGKVVWNKRNLAGQKVASGVYIVLLTTDDGSESATTKIAIVN
ncbi:two-component regulator propeller domain-containing protein [uncultured Tenacibaculum sp.]|uniref:type IX secretion system anionic LPS delivery protein PorZ n=1 Tax=uncultured Tenacibaculum sp. TaxID=174713 RepID=UPI0026268DA3|nr:two-component regulator propeller domain-containing protein [uncultured Tenacibaculum sp.]